MFYSSLIYTLIYIGLRLIPLSLPWRYPFCTTYLKDDKAKHFSPPPTELMISMSSPWESQNFITAKKKNVQTLCKAGQTLQSPVYLKQAHFPSVSQVLHLPLWHSLQNLSSLKQKHPVYHLLVGPNEAGSSIEMGKFCLPEPSQGSGKWSLCLR